MNLTQLILKQAKIFPTIKEEQLYRLVNSYSPTPREKFNIEFSYLVSKDIIKVNYDQIEGFIYSV